MLRRVRITLAAIFWLLLTWLLVDFTGTAHAYLRWMCNIQFMPALLSLNVGVLLFLLALTLLWGRIYCSVICPLGVMQDIISALRRRKYKYRFTPERKVLRWSMVLAAGAAMVLGLNWLASMVFPESIFGRFAATVIAPLYNLGNNMVALAAEHYNSYAAYRVEVWTQSIATLAIALIFWVVIAVLAWRGGRTWCNTVCPVGTLLGALSRKAIFRPVINLDRCNSCGLCERECKAGCIDSGNHAIDLSRCVMCGNCMEACHKKALTLSSCTTPVEESESTPRSSSRRGRGGRGNGRSEESRSKAATAAPKKENTKAATPAPKKENSKAATAAPTEESKKPRRRRGGRGRNKPKENGAPATENTASTPTREPDTNRRAMLTTSVLLAGSLVAHAQRHRHGEGKTTDGGLAPIVPKENPKRAKAILPPGALSARRFQSQCTACQMCVTACPSKVLRPSTDLATFLQPRLEYDRGYCRPECTRCSEVCPADAIQPISREQRTAIQVGHAVWRKELCIPAQEGKPCGTCARRCPNGAIKLVPANDGYRRGDNGRWTDPSGNQIDGRMVPMVPAINTEKCTGCGACEHLCPVSPQSAIYVEGHDVQHEI